MLLAASIPTMALTTTQTSPPATAPSTDWWPTFRHDLQHTGNTSSPGPVTNASLWTFDTHYFVYSEPAVVNDRMYFGDAKGHVYCLDTNTGEQLWNYTTGNWVTATPNYYDGKVYFNSEDCYYYCLNATNGALVWKYNTSYAYGGYPTVANGKVYFGSSKGYKNNGVIYCLNATDGRMIWNLSVKEFAFSSPAYLDGNIYIGSSRLIRHIFLFIPVPEYIYCINATTGAIVWKEMTGLNTWQEPPEMCIANGKLYYAETSMFGGKLGCLDVSTGAAVWQKTVYRSFNQLVFLGIPSISYGKLYFMVDDFAKEVNEVRCIDAATGSHIWTFKEGCGFPTCSNGKVYFGTLGQYGSDVNGTVYCLDGNTGAKIWTTPEVNVIAPGSIVNGRFFVGTLDDNVHCFGS